MYMFISLSLYVYIYICIEREGDIDIRPALQDLPRDERSAPPGQAVQALHPVRWRRRRYLDREHELGDGRQQDIYIYIYIYV